MKYILSAIAGCILTFVVLAWWGHGIAKDIIAEQEAAQISQEIDTSAVNEIVEMIQELESRIEQEDVSSEQAQRLREKLRNRIEESYQTSISTQQYQEFIEA